MKIRRKGVKEGLLNKEWKKGTGGKEERSQGGWEARKGGNEQKGRKVSVIVFSLN